MGGGNIVDRDGDNLNIAKDGALLCKIENQTDEPVDALFSKSISTFTLAADAVASTEIVLNYNLTFSPGHGVITGNTILLLDPLSNKFFQGKVLNVVTDTITLDRPVDYAFPAASTLGRVISTSLNVDGSVTPQIFSIRGGSPEIHITRIILTMTTTAAMDDGKFGSLSALTRGVVVRIVNSYQKTIFNWKTNGDIALFSFDAQYADKAAAGTYGFRARCTFNGEDKHGVALSIGSEDYLQVVIQDNLSTLTSFKAVAQGHYLGVN